MTQTSSESSPKPENKVVRTRGQKWRRRGIILLVVLIVVAIALRLMVPVLLPPVLRKVARGFGLDATYDKLELYALDGDVGLWNLRFTPIEGGEPVLRTSYCRGSINTWSLLRGKLNVVRVEAEDAQVLVERKADGTLPLLEKFIAKDATAQPATPQPAAKSSVPVQISLDAPLNIDVLRLQHASARFKDFSQEQPTDVSVQLDMLVTDVGSEDHPTKLEIQVHSPEALVAMYIKATATARNNQLDADLSLNMFGLNLQPASQYLKPLGIVPTSSNISAQADGHLTAKVKQIPTADPAAKSTSELSATLSLANMQLSADSQAVASVKSIRVDIPTITPGRVSVGTIALNGIRGNASRNKEGRLAFGGIELQPVSPAATAQPARPTTRPAGEFSMPVLELGKLSVNDVELAFNDAATAEPVKLTFNLPTLAIEHLTTSAKPTTQPATIALRASADGIAREIQVNGTLTPIDRKRELNLQISAAGISPKALETYLSGLGLRNDLTDATFKCSVVGSAEVGADDSITAALKLQNTIFSDQGRELFNLANVEVGSLSINSSMDRFKVSQVSIDGPAIPIQRDEAGKLSLLGLKLDPANAKQAAPNSQTASSAQPPATTQPAGEIRFPAIELGKFEWRNASIVLDDRQVKDHLKLSVNNIAVVLNDIILDPSAKSAKQGTIHATAAMPGVMEHLNLDGTISPADNSIGFAFHGKGEGITAAELKPLLALVHVQPILSNGSVEFTAAGNLSADKSNLAANVDISNVKFVDGESQLLALDALHVRKAAFDGKVASIDEISVDKPSAAISRDEAGLLSVGGMKMLAPVKVAGQAAPTTAPSAPTRIDLSSPVVVRVKSVKLTEANLGFHDDFVIPSSNLSAVAAASLADVSFGEDAPLATFSGIVTIPGTIDSLEANGRFSLAPAKQQLQVAVKGTGITGKSIEPYLPPNATTQFQNGQFTASLDVSAEPNPVGGTKASLQISDVALSDGIAPMPVAGVKSIHVGIDRIDLQARKIAVDEIAVTGANLNIAQDDNGITAMGLRLNPKPQRTVRPPAEEAEAVAGDGASDVNALLATARQKPPLFTLNKFLFQADRLAVTSPTLSRALAVTNLTIKSTAPIEQLGDEPTARPPFDLTLDASVERLVDSIHASAHLAPLASEPSASIVLDVTGIRGNELTDLVPKLKDVLDGSELSDGRFTSNADMKFKFTRRGALGIDLSRDITTDLLVTNTKLSQAGVAMPLAGINEIHGENMKFSLADGSLVIRAIDITKPMGRVLRDKTGIHALGLTIKPPSTQPTTVPAAETTVPKTQGHVGQLTAVPTSEPVAEKAKPSPEIRVDRFSITDVDFVIEDRAGTTPTLIPITELDVKVKGLTTAALNEPKPIRFSAIVGAGKVSLPSNDKKNPGMQERPVFSEASASGNVVLVPKPKGYVKLSLSGLELNAVRGTADQMGIKIEHGTFDLRTDVRMEGVDAIEARVYPTFNELRVSEGNDGPIKKLFNLPAPLDVAVGLLEDADGSITFPVVVPLEAGKLNTGAVIGSAVGSVGRVVGEAMLAAPLKAAKLGSALLGGDTASDRTKGLTPVAFDFAAGESQITEVQQQAIASVLERMRKDDTLEVTVQHSLGQPDVDVTGQRANPFAQDSLELAARLRQRKAELQLEQTNRSTRLAVALASLNKAAADESLESLRSTAVQLKETEDSLDQVLELLRPGAETQSDRRTKAAAILLSDLRIRSAMQSLLSSDVKNIADRVRKSNPAFNPDGQAGKITLVLMRRAKQ